MCLCARACVCLCVCVCVCVCVCETPLLVFSFSVGSLILDCGCVSSHLEDVRVAELAQLICNLPPTLLAE